MAYLLAGSTIKRPKSIVEGNNTQFAEQRTLSGAIGRDQFGSNKRVWTLEYENITVTDFNTIKAIYDSYLSTGTPQTFESTETNYTIASTNVHVILPSREFKVGGDQYISAFTLVLKEA